MKAFPEIHIAGEAVNAREARERIQTLQPDLVFLDIQMPEETGFELLDSLGDKFPRIIFTTAYDAFALRAFEFGAVDYLLKPIAPKRLAIALQRACATDGRLEPAEDLEATDLPTRPLGLQDKVLLGSSDRIAYVPVGSIIAAESVGAYSKVWFEDSALVIRRSLSVLEARLPTEFFMRANRSQLINLQQVQSVEPWFSGGMKLKLSGDLTVELSRRQAKVFRERNTL
ncbi:LytTR family DNA-binding domain-containing protein [Haloferula sp. BvORR071]|uniref:LytR/AlgR family response regulator transcription factor n=1 Tax=Haloferula sp. BvORR071 TaxID=1396141 RepID=UPI0022410454|nr:LytTR family DNA-binding domain-containing protein [Haloferula sp. BvORR071]